MKLTVFLVSSALTLVDAVPARALQLPSPLDSNEAIFADYWEWLKAETGAPFDLPWPRITVSPLPPNARMAFAFPTRAAPWQEARIIVSPRSMDRAADGSLDVIGELAHELVHYVLLMAENEWDWDREIFTNQIHHHCDPEFQRLNRYIGRLIWSSYHSADTLRAVDHMISLACWRDGHLNVGLD